MENQTPFWMLAVALPLALVMVGIGTRDTVGLLLAGLLWLSLVFKYEGRQRAVCIGGLVLLAAIAGLVVWARSGA